MTDPKSGSPEFAIQFTHVDAALRLPGGPSIADHCLAESLYGVDPTTTAEVRAEIALRVRAAAGELLADTEFAASFASLPIGRGDTVVAFGDSITADLHSWARILAEAFEQADPAQRPTFVNLGRSADTTTHLLERFADVIAARPTHVIVQVGTNDAKAFDFTAGAPLVSPDTTRRNTALLVETIQSLGAAVTWILPPTIDAQAASNCAMWTDQLMQWHPQNFVFVRDAMREVVANPVDLTETFGDPALPSLMLDDGLHPNLEGHQAIVKALIAHLVR
ncbi:GDSL-type esterase/lipase family protein [Nocardia sp. R7R-8]|uniref:GDSL-type esterase/lipase family protein n=1 Tax=Nocardia sp. R7R-8 TaxID=3459304 RepID=UPI00403D97AF